MKKLFYVFALSFYTSAYSAAADTNHNFDGTWQLNNADGYFGGTMEIYNCTDAKCDFKLQSWYDQHICDTDGQIVLTSATTGTYTDKKYVYEAANDKEYFVPVGITFDLLPDGGLRLTYANFDSHGAFCGMSATVEGMWYKSKN